MVIGSCDRALERKARAENTLHTIPATSRVISLQNRTRMTQSPCRACEPPVNTPKSATAGPTR
ncbi:MAG: hypothetical protein A2503_13480 [Burkholderiales bacterium RIFOXYD12_FULL_59_19]|nr:MAG: hypothetical protein A2503_13480 [Burkholderiales bacterium RIFOXYD12_FULL_59_19]